MAVNERNKINHFLTRLTRKNRQQILSNLFQFWCISLQQGEPAKLTQMGKMILKFRDTNMKYISG